MINNTDVWACVFLNTIQIIAGWMFPHGFLISSLSKILNFTVCYETQEK